MKKLSLTWVLSGALLLVLAVTMATDGFGGDEGKGQKRRFGLKSYENIVRTNELYGNDGLWLGPRGRDYGDMLPNPKPYQIANLYPDPSASYWMAFLEMPKGSELVFKGRFPYARYIQFAMYRANPIGSYDATGERLLDNDIEPDPGSVNPFVPGADRMAKSRNYTLRILNEDPPADRSQRKPNTLYAGMGNKIQMVYRLYLPDHGRDGSGDVGLPTYTATLADGTKLSAEEVRERFNTPLTKNLPSGLTVEQWRALCNAPDNDPVLKPESTPARNPGLVDRYFNNEYNFVGVFKSPEDRAKLNQEVQTGFGGDPVTLYLFAFVSRAFDPVLVIRGKMPVFPDTYMGKDGKGLKTMTDWETRYWSIVIAEAPPSGLGGDALFDMQVPLDKDRNYTIVVCRPEDRPANATVENGVAWMNWVERGEGIDDPSNRKDFGFLVWRYMYNNPNWKHSPDKILKPGTEAEIMGPYLPRLTYTDKATFEKEGLKMGANTVKPYTFPDTRDMRFGELLVLTKEGIDAYNTVGLNDCPADLWNALNTDKLAQEYGALKVIPNGPKFFMMDSQVLHLGKTASFGGIDARWAARVDPTAAKNPPYVPYVSRRTHRMTYSKGKPVFELVDPEGNAYVMQAHHHQFSMESLATLGQQMSKLPDGWRYRTRVLNEDLELDLRTDTPTFMVGDEFHQYYTRISNVN